MKVAHAIQNAVKALENAQSAHPCPMYEYALWDLKRASASALKMQIAMETFVQRVELGEVRSVKTYAEFKAILKEAS